MTRATTRGNPNWIIIIVILVIAGGAILFLQSSGKSIPNSGDATRLALSQSGEIGEEPANSCPLVTGCSTTSNPTAGLTFNNEEDARQSALTACDATIPTQLAAQLAIWNSACGFIVAGDASRCVAADCAYHADNPNATPCEIQNCSETIKHYYDRRGNETSWTTTWQCTGIFRVSASATCTPIP